MHEIEYLTYILSFLISAIFIVVIFKKLKLSPVLGYLVAGILIGIKFEVLKDSLITKSLAEFGIVFLLFVIGLELSTTRLISMWKKIFIVGSSQFLITAIVIGLISFFFISNFPASFVIAVSLAISSTAIVLKVISEEKMQSTQVGRTSIAILLLQDLAVVPLFVIIPLIAKSTSGSIGDPSEFIKILAISGIKICVAFLLIFVLSRLLLGRLFNLIISTKLQDIFIALNLLIVLGAAWFTHHIGLSLAFGAFIAGTMIAETEYQEEVYSSIAPFKNLFLGLFFMTVGMQLNLDIILTNFISLISLAFGLIIVKAVIIFGLCVLFGINKGSSIHIALLLAQGGEFAFVLFDIASGKDIISEELKQLLLVVVGITMAITPLLAYLAKKLERKINAKCLDDNLPVNVIENKQNTYHNHIIIVGFGEVGTTIGKLLKQENIEYLALDNKIEVVNGGRKDGYNVYLGDALDNKNLESAGISGASAIIVALPDKHGIEKLSKNIKRDYPETPIIVRTPNDIEAEKIKNTGIDDVISETSEVGIKIATIVMKKLGMEDTEIIQSVHNFKSTDEDSKIV